LEEGRLIELLVLHNFGDSLTCCPANSPLIRHVLDTQVRQAAKLVAESKEGSYAPRADEVCLAKFTGNATKQTKKYFFLLCKICWNSIDVIF
jgi:hypothetical protein